MKLSTNKLYKVKIRKVLEHTIYIEADSDISKSELKTLTNLAIKEYVDVDKNEPILISSTTKVTPVYSDDVLFGDWDDQESYALSLDEDKKTLKLEVDDGIDIPLPALHMMQPSRPK